MLIGDGQSHLGVFHMFATKQIPGARHGHVEMVGIARRSRKALCATGPR